MKGSVEAGMIRIVKSTGLWGQKVLDSTRLHICWVSDSGKFLSLSELLSSG